MPLLNYTTEIPATRSIAEIMTMLQRGGACAVLLENEPDGSVSKVSFQMETSFGRQSFALPANVAAVQLAINAEIKREGLEARGRRKIPSNLFNDKPQAERIAWRIVKDWLEAQLAIHQIGAAKMEQVLLPFAVDETGKTFYERLIARGGPLLLS